jgi:Zn-dependent protease
MSRGPARPGGADPPARFGDVSLSFDARELRDLAVAWAALGLAFAVFFAGGGRAFLSGTPVRLFAVSTATAGVGFLLHELAHKVAAVRLGLPAAFRADYGMLFLAVASALAGFLFAAPGAVYHPGGTSDRDSGLIALAGPATNVALALLFLPALFAGNGGLLGQVGTYGVSINLLLAGFNMLPFGPLDGKKVLAWSKAVFVLAVVLTVGPAALVVLA